MFCNKCKIELKLRDTYEYRGAYSCSECFDEVIKSRDYERQEIIEEENAKTKVFKGLDLSDNAIGKANREILKTHIEIAKKESNRLKNWRK